MTTCFVPDDVWTNSTNSTRCILYDDINQQFFTFDGYQLGRVVVTWILFVLSVAGNIFVLICIGGEKGRWNSNHIVMFNVALADLLYACTVLPIDGVWNITMQWYGGDVLCRISQMVKQMGMYSSANMVMVIGVTRAWTIVGLRTATNATKRTKILVCSAWVMSVICSIPAGIFFSSCQILTCEGNVLTQCVDNVVFSQEYLHPYHFFTMVMSFILPVFVTVVCGLIIVNAITLMKDNQPSVKEPRKDLSKAIIITTNMKTAITLTFLVCWTPYYAIGIIYWFGLSMPETNLISIIAYMMLYLNCFLHPIIFGLFTKKVKQKFAECVYSFKEKAKCSKDSTDKATKQDLIKIRTTQDGGSISNDQTKLMTTEEQSV